MEKVIFSKRFLPGSPLAAWLVAVMLGPSVTASTTAKADLQAAVATCALIVRGQPAQQVFVPSAANADELAAAKEWAEVLGKMCGTQPRVDAEPVQISSSLPPGIYIGDTVAGRAQLAQHPPGDLDGFVIVVDAANRTVVLDGVTPRATGFAVDWFLERRCGVNWYFPGALGEVIPLRADWQIPQGVTVQAPAYLSREFTGLGSVEDQTWAKHNLLEARFVFLHNLAGVFPPRLYDQHPDFFPLIGGARVRPPAPDGQISQPDFSNPAVAAYAAARARQFFDDHPGVLSFSLGLNDGTVFDEGPGTKALTLPRRWFRGRPDFSDLVFTFMNRAAEDLAPAYPDKYLGCLAYYWCENTPSFPVRAQVLPYLTNDRSFYDQPEWAANDLALIRRWAHAGPQIIGIYDYYYGTPFAVPRIFTSAEVKSLREAHAAGARAFNAELNPAWSYDALKAWLAARLLWDPEADAAALEAQFYGDLYGPAAGDVRKFFELAEAAWREQDGAPRWIKGYKDPYQALIFSPARTEAMSLALSRAESCNLTSLIRARLAILQSAWTASVQAIASATTEANVADDTAQHVAAVENGLRLAGTASVNGAACGFYLRAADWAGQHFQRRWLEDALAGAAVNDDPAGLTARNVFAPRGPNLLSNGALQTTAVGHAPIDWNLNSREAEHVRFGPGLAKDPEGGPTFAVSGSDWLVFWQDVQVEPEKFYEASFLWRGKVPLGTRAHWAIAYYDAAGRFLECPWQAAAAPGDHAVWLREGAVTSAPAKAASLRLLIYVAAQGSRDEVQFAEAGIWAIQ